MFHRSYARLRKTISFLKSQKRRCLLFRRVDSIFKNNLFFANCITSGSFMFVGDLIQQEIEFQAKILQTRYDWARLCRMLLVGTLMGPIDHFYYLHLDKFLPQANLKSVAIKLLCDQIFETPATIIFFFYGLAVLENKPFIKSTEEIRQKFKFIYVGDCLFWIPVQFFNFYCLPTEYRVLYMNVASMIYNVFLSYMKHLEQH